MMSEKDAWGKAKYWSECQPGEDWFIVEYKKGRFDCCTREHILGGRVVGYYPKTNDSG